MGDTVYTNRLNVRTDPGKLSARFDFIKVSTSEKYFGYGARVLDVPASCNRVRSVYFERGRVFHVLAEKMSPEEFQALKDAVRDGKGGESISMERVTAREVPLRALVQLLLNALGSYSKESLRINNLTGHLYCEIPEKRSFSKKTNELLKIPCLELSVAEDMSVRMNVRTFTSMALKKRMNQGKESVDELPKYVFGAREKLRRKAKGDDGPEYVLRQTRGSRTAVSYLSLSGKDGFKSSKMGILAEVLDLFSREYEGMCDISLERRGGIVTLQCSPKTKAEDREKVASCLQGKNLRIVDTERSGESGNVIELLQAKFKELYGIRPKRAGQPKDGCLNLIIIHDAEYYEENGLDDPHDRDHGECAVQHLTLENIQADPENEVRVLAQELVIKDDILKGKMSLYDWARLGLGRPLLFGLAAGEKKAPRHFFMRIEPDGSFSFAEAETDLLRMAEFSACLEALESDGNPDAVIQDGDGSIVTVTKTGLTSIPEIFGIRDELEKENTSLRNEKKREELLSAVTEIRLYEEDGAFFYFVGEIGKGMQATVSQAPDIRRVEAYRGDKSFFRELLPLMNVSFVRNGRPTVIPFPFKYLREYARQHGVKNF